MVFDTKILRGLRKIKIIKIIWSYLFIMMMYIFYKHKSGWTLYKKTCISTKESDCKLVGYKSWIFPWLTFYACLCVVK